MQYWKVLFLAAFLCAIIDSINSLITDQNEGIKYLNQTNSQLGQQQNILAEARWAYATNISNQTSEAQQSAIATFNTFQKNQSLESLKYDWSSFDETYQRQFDKLAVIGTAALEDDDEKTYIKVSSEMETIYSSATACVDDRCDLTLDGELSEILSTSKNYSEMEEVWVNWRAVSGNKMRDNYITYYKLGNKAATLNKLPTQTFRTLDDLWLFAWETPDIKDKVEKLWEQLKPFYQKLHAYVRMNLDKAFPGKMPTDKTIPAHLLGNMWAQTWSSIMNTVPGVDPYDDVSPIDVTQALIDQNYDAIRMFNLSDKFFGDLGLEKMTDLFWKNSVLVRPSPNHPMVCHASAWDFYVKDDFRIKQCTNINMKDLITVHHEMGHVEYYMQYQDQPVVYRRGANPGFHEAIGDLLALSVSTPNHLIKIGLLNETSPDDKEKINLKYQLKMALDKVVFLPFAYIVDKWRWDVFSGQTDEYNLNRHWWELRIQYQGLSPPVKRSENDFDPGAKYHIPASVEYIRYLLNNIH